MKVGRIAAVQPMLTRNVEVRISSDEFYSAISNPKGPIKAGDVVGCDIVEKRRELGSLLYEMHFRITTGPKVLFYTAETQFDIVLLLDQCNAALPKLSSTWKKLDQP